MKYFAGLDVSLNATAICVVDEQGGILRKDLFRQSPMRS
jgi:hypothetical protein